MRAESDGISRHVCEPVNRFTYIIARKHAKINNK
nr:MAG TPA: hypothetical protein [Caudoviricetes sp.]